MALGPTLTTKARRREAWWRRHKALTALVILLLVCAAGVVAFVLVVNSKLGNIPRIDLGEHADGSKVLTAPTGNGLNILLVGVDNGEADGPRVKEMAEGQWQAGRFRSDTIMLVHLTADKKKAYIFSFPRDSWVSVPGYGDHKINAAFSFGGPELLIATLKDLGLKDVHHLVAIDWNGFRNLTDRLGGVEIDGEILQGKDALTYVRERKSLPGGDFDRIKRQQNFLRALMVKVIGGGLLDSPGRLLDTLDWAGSNMLVDAQLTHGGMRDLAGDLRDLRPKDVEYYTAPNTGTGMVGEASVVHLDLGLTRQLLGAVTDDEVEAFLEEHREAVDRLGSAGSVN